MFIVKKTLLRHRSATSSTSSHVSGVQKKTPFLSIRTQQLYGNATTRYGSPLHRHNYYSTIIATASSNSVRVSSRSCETGHFHVNVLRQKLPSREFFRPLISPSSYAKTPIIALQTQIFSTEPPKISLENEVESVKGKHHRQKHEPNTNDPEHRHRYLFNEASSLTRSLYRKCLRSIRVLSRGNEKDEKEFLARERFESEGGKAGRISMALPVNRKNELESRTNYYRSFARENFDGHFGLLSRHGFYIGEEDGHGFDSGGRKGRNDETPSDLMWREEQIDQFVYLIRSGEEKRRWILNDYGFDDPCNNCFDVSDGGHEDNRRSDGWPSELEYRLESFEKEANSFVKTVYRQHGWNHSSDFKEEWLDDEEFSDDEGDN